MLLFRRCFVAFRAERVSGSPTARSVLGETSLFLAERVSGAADSPARLVRRRADPTARLVRRRADSTARLVRRRADSTARLVRRRASKGPGKLMRGTRSAEGRGPGPQGAGRCRACSLRGEARSDPACVIATSLYGVCQTLVDKSVENV
jgi:hypothetical protein